MRGVFSAVALLVVLAVVGLAVTKQLKSAGTVHATTGQPAASGVAGETPQQVQQRVRDDVAKALEQGAAARRQEPGQ